MYPKFLFLLSLHICTAHAAQQDWDIALAQICKQLSISPTTVSIQISDKLHLSRYDTKLHIIQVGEKLDSLLECDNALRRDKRSFILFILGHEMHHCLTETGHEHLFGSVTKKMWENYSIDQSAYKNELAADYLGCFLAQLIDKNPELDILWRKLQTYTNPNDSTYPPLTIRTSLNQNVLHTGREMYVTFKAGVLSAAVGDFQTAVECFGVLQTSYRLGFLQEVQHNLTTARIALAQQLYQQTSDTHADYLLPLRWYFNSAMLTENRRTSGLNEAALSAKADSLLQKANADTQKANINTICIRYLKKDSTYFYKEFSRKKKSLNSEEAWVTGLASETLCRRPELRETYWAQCDTTEQATRAALDINRSLLRGDAPAVCPTPSISVETVRSATITVPVTKIKYSSDFYAIETANFIFSYITDSIEISQINTLQNALYACRQSLGVQPAEAISVMYDAKNFALCWKQNDNVYYYTVVKK